MSERPTNPSENTYGAGVSESAVLQAVVRSGYPLQTVIGARLQESDYSLAEEWAYVDADSEELRTLDLLAGKNLQPDFATVSTGRLTTGLTLLIECKQSELPYVGFQSVTRPGPPSFPRITGLPTSRAKVAGNDPTRSISVGSQSISG